MNNNKNCELNLNINIIQFHNQRFHFSEFTFEADGSHPALRVVRGVGEDSLWDIRGWARPDSSRSHESAPAALRRRDPHKLRRRPGLRVFFPAVPLL